MAKEFEIIVYGVQYMFDNFDNELDNAEIQQLSDEDFIERAEEEGNVMSLNNFMRELEAINYGAKSPKDYENMSLRAYIIDLEQGGNYYTRIDTDRLRLRVSSVIHSM